MTIGEDALGSSSKLQQAPVVECCMCGDYGLPYELFRCKLCNFRSQHRYCSNLYPKAESYRLCNWCLTKEGETHSPNSSPALLNRKSVVEFDQGQDDDKRKNYEKNQVIKVGRSNNSTSTCQLQLINGNSNNPIKKQRCLDQLSSGTSGRKKLISIISSEESALRRTKSEEIRGSAAAAKHVTAFRGKARRYKLLHEVSSQ